MHDVPILYQNIQQSMKAQLPGVSSIKSGIHMDRQIALKE